MSAARSGSAGEAEVAVQLPPVCTLDAGGRILPSAYAASPWLPGAQHGGAMIALLARAIERHPADRPVRVTRLTVDMMRAAPIAPIETPCRVIRSGRMVETLEASIVSDGVEYVRASAVRTRVASIDTSMARVPDGGPPERQEGREYSPPDGVIFFARCMQMQPGRCPSGEMIWYRMRTPLVEGEPLTPLQRAAATSDFAYGTRFLLQTKRDREFVPDREFTTINPDTTLQLVRDPRGEWIGLESRTHLGDEGSGIASAVVWDAAGIVGHVTQSILVRSAGEARPAQIGWSTARRDGKRR